MKTLVTVVKQTGVVEFAAAPATLVGQARPVGAQVIRPAPSALRRSSKSVEGVAWTVGDRVPGVEAVGPGALPRYA